MVRLVCKRVKQESCFSRYALCSDFFPVFQRRDTELGSGISLHLEGKTAKPSVASVPLAMQLLQCKSPTVFCKQLRWFFSLCRNISVFELLEALGVPFPFQLNAIYGLVRGGMNTEHIQRRVSHQHPTMWILRPTVNCFLSLLVFSECSRRERRLFQGPVLP